LLAAPELDEFFTPEGTIRKKSIEEILEAEQALLLQAAQAADAVVRATVFQLDRERKATVTVKAEDDALAAFTRYLREVGVPLSSSLAQEPRLWTAITFGLVTGFKRWAIWKQGYALKTVQNYLSSIKLYAKLAQQAGFQTAEQFLAIQHIPTIRGKEARRIDERREELGIPTRIGHKKAEPTFLSKEEFWFFIERPDTPQGWRDRIAILLMCDLSLRPYEALSRKLKHLDMEKGTISVFRFKTEQGKEVETHQLTQRLYLAIATYLKLRKDGDPEAPLLVRTLKSEALVERVPRSPEDPTSPLWTPPLSIQGLGQRIHELGNEVGHEFHHPIDLTSYDLRHWFARFSIDGGTDPIAAKKAGG
jgi:integrase